MNSGAANGSKYQVKSGRDYKPVVYVSFFDAMRFTNWLQNGQGSGSTESGVYTIGNGSNEIRNPAAAYFIPSENEWYKAAYHKNDGVTAHYWEYATSSHAEPFSIPPGTTAPVPSNTANYGLANGLTDVGAYTASLRPYGTFDQTGNVNEWNEAVFEAIPVGSPFPQRGIRGGNWFTPNEGVKAYASYRSSVHRRGPAAPMVFVSPVVSLSQVQGCWDC